RAIRSSKWRRRSSTSSTPRRGIRPTKSGACFRVSARQPGPRRCRPSRRSRGSSAITKSPARITARLTSCGAAGWRSKSCRRRRCRSCAIASASCTRFTGSTSWSRTASSSPLPRRSCRARSCRPSAARWPAAAGPNATEVRLNGQETGVYSRRMRHLITASAFIASVALLSAQVADPLPNVEKRGLTVEIRDLVRLPQTRGLRPADQDVNPSGWARVSYVRDLPDGRRFANDSRGFLYLLDRNNQPHVYLDITKVFPLAVYNRLESGLISFTFHPEFATNGLMYTAHSERGPGNPATPNFIPPGYTAADVTYHNIVTEWHTSNPSADVFEGTRREIFRDAHIVQNLTHPPGVVEFNPTAKPGSPDYGLLYIGGTDHGFSNGGGPHANDPAQTQRLDSVITA